MHSAARIRELSSLFDWVKKMAMITISLGNQLSKIAGGKRIWYLTEKAVAKI